MILHDTETIARHMERTGKVAKPNEGIKFDVVDTRLFRFKDEDTVIRESICRDGAHILEFTCAENTDVYVCRKPDYFKEGSRDEVLRDDNGWIFAELEDQSKGADSLVYDNYLEPTDGIVYEVVAGPFYGTNGNGQKVAIAQIWGTNAKGAEPYIIVIECGSLIRMYEGYISTSK